MPEIQSEPASNLELESQLLPEKPVHSALRSEAHPFFTYAYSQPDGYHFCQDSILAPRIIATDLADALTKDFLAKDFLDPSSHRKTQIQNDFRADFRALDVCAGCGVMGFELLYALGELAQFITQFDFLEIQDEFHLHFERNLKITGSKNRTRWIADNYSLLNSADFAKTYDLIIANPPYFLSHEGSQSPNALNNRARFFIDADMRTLFRGLQNALKPGGRAYVLVKSGKQHGRDAFTGARVEMFDCQITRLGAVRGTELLKIISAEPALYGASQGCER